MEIPSIDLGECYQKLKEKNKITNNLILGIFAKRNKTINYPIIISFSVYSPYDGAKLNISICQKYDINIEEDIAMKIPDKDICFYFDSPFKKDVALKDRVKLFYPNITLCENGCEIKGINATSMKAICKCRLDDLMNNNILSNNVWYQAQVEEIEQILNEINIEIIKCGPEILKHRNISSFYGSFVILFLISAQIIILILHIKKGIIPLTK